MYRRVSNTQKHVINRVRAVEYYNNTGDMSKILDALSEYWLDDSIQDAEMDALAERLGIVHDIDNIMINKYGV